jgi:phage shock protein C
MVKLNRLYRSRRTRIIAGVAGGLAEYFAVDVVFIRVLWVIAAFVVGGGILAYLIAWIAIPEEGQGDNVVFPGADGDDFPPAAENGYHLKRQRNAGLLLIGLGIIFLIHQVFGPFLHLLWPLLIVAAGIFLLIRSGREAGE